MEPYGLGVDDSSVYSDKTAAFGTGIGDRKINARPQFAWNAYRMPRKITPQWWNGNYMNVPGEVKSTGYWDSPDTLGGATPSYWDKYQSVLAKEQEDEKKEKRQVIYPSSGTVQGVIEGFDSPDTGCGCGVPPAWLMILLFIVVVLIVIVMNVINFISTKKISISL